MDTQEIQSIANLSEKIDSLTLIIQDGFKSVNNRLDNVETRLHKVEDGIVGLDKRLLVVETNITGIDKRLSNVETRINSVEGNLPAISEKFGELKNWRQISLIALAAIIGWFVRGGKM